MKSKEAQKKGYNETKIGKANHSSKYSPERILHGLTSKKRFQRMK